MKKTTSTLLTITLGAFCATTAFAEIDVAQAEKIYKRSCATCHGKSADRSALGQSAIINQLNTDEISTALSDRRSGKIMGAGNPVKSRLTDEEIKALAEFVPMLR